MAADARIRITRFINDAALADEIAPKLANLGNAIGRRMQRLVPKRTWALHDTIVAGPVERRGSKLTLAIGAGSDKVRYALHVERGTSRMAAQPYMRPALLQSKAADLVNDSPMNGTRGAQLQKRRENAALRRQDRAESAGES